MKKRNAIDKDDFKKFMKINWVLYASETRDEKKLRISINGNKKFLVTHGKETIFLGYDLDKALEFWEMAG